MLNIVRNERCAYFINIPRIFIKRNCHSNVTDENNAIKKRSGVRVRFAPSPTGYLHLGGLRTALYNFLFARANQGKFIMRIEDTDQKRIVPDATDSLFNDLEWAGIIPDESEIHGGDHGPYMQSKRLEIYRTEVQKLLENGNAYYCFCTQSRLEQLRKEAEREQRPIGYDNRCRLLTPVQIAEKLANHDSFCIRFKMEPDELSYNDLIGGRIELPTPIGEGDPIIIKSDGYPTYHFANVVDDHLMDISHVLRGIEWRDSMFKHLQLYDAFGWKPPQFGHLPLMLNHDGSKLSKRQSHAHIEYYRSKGVFPQALINFVTRTGGGFATNIEDRPKSYSMSELQKRFDLELINSRSGRLIIEQLDECNRLEIGEHINDPIKCEELIQRVQELIKAAYPNEADSLALDKVHIRNVLHWATDRITSLHQLVEGNLSFLWILPKIKDDDLHGELLESLITQLEKGEFEKQHLQNLLKEFSTKNNLKFPNFMKALRGKLSGFSEGPGVADMMAILGKKVTIQRIQKMVTKRKLKEDVEKEIDARKTDAK